ncbi:hypothetical protein B6E66_23525 [Streptomyces maremycinicus]|nr:hypothetical protein B6E66_23525 [Streptomyces sp. B9173]
MTRFKAAAVQFTAVPLDTARNARDIEQHVRRCAEDGAALIVLPELCHTGYTLTAELARASDPLPGPAGDLLYALAADLGVTLVTSLAVRTPEQTELRNTGLIVTPDGIVASGAKRALWGAESQVFIPGRPDEQVIADTPVGRVGVAICYEGGFPEVTRQLALHGAQIIAMPSAFGAARLHAWKLMTRSRALENGCHVVAANHSGPSAGFDFCGHSTIVDPQGERKALLPAGEGRIVAEIDLRAVDEARSAVPYLRDLYRVITPNGAPSNRPKTGS